MAVCVPHGLENREMVTSVSVIMQLLASLFQHITVMSSPYNLWSMKFLKYSILISPHFFP
jgi:hypothetical protein